VLGSGHARGGVGLRPGMLGRPARHSAPLSAGPAFGAVRACRHRPVPHSAPGAPTNRRRVTLASSTAVLGVWRSNPMMGGPKWRETSPRAMESAFRWLVQSPGAECGAGPGQGGPGRDPGAGAGQAGHAGPGRVRVPNGRRRYGPERRHCPGQAGHWRRTPARGRPPLTGIALDVVRPEQVDDLGRIIREVKQIQVR